MAPLLFNDPWMSLSHTSNGSRSCISGRYSIFFKDRQGSHCASPPSSNTAQRLRSSAQAKEVLVSSQNIDYLGYAIRPGRLKIPNTTNVAIKNLNNPTIKAETRSFLGFCNVFCRFLLNFTCVDALSNKKLCED